MRVAHFIQRYPPALGGSEAYFARLSRFLAAQGDQVTVFTSSAIDLEAFWSRRGRSMPAGVTHEDGVEVRRYPLWRWPGRRYCLKLVSSFPQRHWQCLTLPCNPISPAMWRAMRVLDQPFDVVHAGAFPYAWPIVCARRLARRWRIPFFLTPFLHLGDPTNRLDSTRRGYTSPALRWLLDQADVVFVQTPSEHQAVCELQASEKTVILQGLGVDARECTGGDRAAARRAWGLASDETVIGHLANNSWEKGTIDLLQAATVLWQRGVPAKLLVAGPEMPNFRAFWRQYSQDLPAETLARVVRLGVLDERHKRDFFAAIDMFALPSRSDSFGLVLLEAWANGVPNVAYRAGGIADVIRHEQDGLLVPCGAVTDLAEALQLLCLNAPERRRMGCAGQLRLEHDFRWEDKLGLVRRAYADVVKEKGRQVQPTHSLEDVFQ
jgi:glycosyltransferase involved in cell wall biosynthesis